MTEYKANLEEIIPVSKSKNIQVVLLTRPYTGESRDERWWKTFEPAYNGAVLEMAMNARIPSIDAYSRFKDRPELFADESHFTEAGHREMAQFVYDQVKQILPQTH